MFNYKKNIEIINHTLSIIENKSYILNDKEISIKELLEFSISNTKTYTNNINKFSIKEDLDLTKTNYISYEDLNNKLQQTNCNISVINEKAIDTFLKNKDYDIAILNFASATEPGGGVLRGAQAQEEDIVRCSGLYPCLTSQENFYLHNLKLKSGLYSDDIIYSPKVPVFKDTDYNLLEEPSLVSIITSPAPNLNHLQKSEFKKVNITLSNRINKILKVAAYNNHKNLILGAFGCGVFGNFPQTVAHLFKTHIQNMNCFENIWFSVYDRSEEKYNFNTFSEVFK